MVKFESKRVPIKYTKVTEDMFNLHTPIEQAAGELQNALARNQTKDFWVYN